MLEQRTGDALDGVLAALTTRAVLEAVPPASAPGARTRARARSVRASLALLAWWSWQEAHTRDEAKAQDQVFLECCPTLYEQIEYEQLDARSQLALVLWTEEAVRRIASVTGPYWADYPASAYRAGVWREVLRDAGLAGVPERFMRWFNTYRA